MMEWIHELLGTDLKAAGLVILNLIIIEGLLSVDNAAVLATMVMDLPENQRSKALKYGIVGAYVFRGLCLIFAAYIIQFSWLKALGGLYLLWLCLSYFLKKEKSVNEEDVLDKKQTGLYVKLKTAIGQFWSTVIIVELVDLAFSIDNVFAAVALSKNIVIVMTGVFIGILAMRFVAQWFIILMKKFPFLSTSAFSVIGILGFKLVLSYACHMHWAGNICEYTEGHSADLYFSIATTSIFLFPVLANFIRKLVYKE